ncbi:MAG: hypothetical protein G01um101433_196 [Parcubacteria group bacterium Gr01-1014_33]|nr:MAG: hypothetical protein G01um101433_196 [Parcubacteria group bacterium Gr01-1014_33]
MRKRLKNKRHSCALCKPHKTGHDCRWNNKDLAGLKAFEKEKGNFVGRMWYGGETV